MGTQHCCSRPDEKILEVKGEPKSSVVKDTEDEEPRDSEVVVNKEDAIEQENNQIPNDQIYKQEIQSPNVAIGNTYEVPIDTRSPVKNENDEEEPFDNMRNNNSPNMIEDSNKKSSINQDVNNFRNQKINSATKQQEEANDLKEEKERIAENDQIEQERKEGEVEAEAEPEVEKDEREEEEEEKKEGEKEGEGEEGGEEEAGGGEAEAGGEEAEAGGEGEEEGGEEVEEVEEGEEVEDGEEGGEEGDEEGEEGDEADQIDKAQDPMDNLGETVVETIYNNNTNANNAEQVNQEQGNAQVEYKKPMTMNEYVNSINQSGGVGFTASAQGAVDVSSVPIMPSANMSGTNDNNEYIQQGSYIVSDNNGNNAFSQYYNASSYVGQTGTDNFNQYYQNADGTTNIDLNNLQDQQVYDLNNFGQNITSNTDFNQYNLGMVSQTGGTYELPTTDSGSNMIYTQQGISDYNTYGTANLEGTFSSPTQTYGLNFS